MPSSTDIFIVTYDADAEWLSYCLRSVKKFASGYSRVAVAYPFGHNKVRDTLANFRGFVHPHVYDEKPPGHMHHQFVKLTCWGRGVTADNVMFLDSDVMFNRPTDILKEMFDADGKPFIRCAPWEWVEKRSGFEIPWRACAEKALQHPCPYECMCAPGPVYPTSVVKTLAKALSNLHKQDLETYICSCWKTDRRWFPDRIHGVAQLGFPDFSEFEALGNYAIAFHPDKVSVYDFSKRPYWDDCPLSAFWSHGGVEANRTKLESILK